MDTLSIYRTEEAVSNVSIIIVLLDQQRAEA
jgi:hypothetical protein